MWPYIGFASDPAAGRGVLLGSDTSIRIPGWVLVSAGKANLREVLWVNLTLDYIYIGCLGVCLLEHFVEL